MKKKYRTALRIQRRFYFCSHSADGKNLPIFAVSVELEAQKSGNFAPAYRISRRATMKKRSSFDIFCAQYGSGQNDAYRFGATVAQMHEDCGCRSCSFCQALILNRFSPKQQ
jgi:hypothetical protein